MIGISAIASAIAEGERDNLAQAKAFGEDEDFVRNRLGPIKLPQMLPDEETSDLATRAVGKLLKQSGTAAEDVQCLIVVTQNPDGRGLPHTSAIVQEKSGLPDSVAAFDISLGCSGYIYGLNAMKGFLESAGLQTGVLVTADPYSKILDLDDRNTAMLFGDAASATLVSTGGTYRIGPSIFGTDGSGAANLVNDNGRLYMNGRQVFNFAATRVPPQIKALLARENLELDEIDCFLLHQGSRYIVETLIRRLKLDADKVPIRLENTGNTVSSSIPLILEHLMDNEDLHKLLLSGFGVGLSWASMVLYRNSN